MKRLIKKSTNENLEEMIDLIEGLAKWCQWDLGTLDVNRMLELNPDCVYNGKLYRGMGTQGYDVLDIIEETNIEFPITVMDIVNKVKKELIYIDNKYCSFTKELQQAEDWNNTRDFNQQSCSYIVEIESKGLDIEKVYNKWKDDINTESMSIINDCLFIKEVISKLSHDFKIYSIQGIKDFSKQINSRDELKEFLNA